MVDPKASAGGAPPSADLAAIRALAEHLRVPAEDVQAWLKNPEGIPPQVLLSWIALWDLGRRKR